MVKVLRPDYIFSFWIFIWYLLFIAKIVSVNPFYLLCFALLVNCIDIIIRLSMNYSTKGIVSYIIITFLMKVLPILHLYNTYDSYNFDVSFIYIFIIHIFWLWMNDMIKYRFIVEKETERTFIPPFEYLFTSILK